MEETHLWLSCMYDEEEQILIDEYSDHVLFDLTSNTFGDSIHLEKHNVELLVNKLNAWLDKQV